jgi:hypothetical protein
MLKRLGLAVAVSLAMGQAGAALHDRGGGMIYDDVLNVTWLANANQGAGSTFDNGGNTTDGRMTWDNAVAWAEALVHGGFSDWRLPTTLQPDASCGSSFDAGPPHGTQSFGFGCTGSELGHMFYNNLGGNANESVLTQTGDSAQEIANLALFTNVQSFVYWSGTEYAPSSLNAWGFISSNGIQFTDGKDVEFFAWAVRPGDVARVPVPGTLALLGLGLGLIGIGRARGRR